MGKFIDLTGKEFGNWLVLRKSNRKNSAGSYWICLCKSCQQEYEIAGTQLRMGRTSQCRSCSNKSRSKSNKDEIKKEQIVPKRVSKHIGEKYGMLTIIDIGESVSGGRKYICQCECGTIVSVRGSNLFQYRTISCGCLKSSYGEYIINKILNDNKVIFQRQYSFPDLRGDKNGRLRFDFAIFNDKKQLIRLIEFQGEQHYKESTFFSSDPRFTRLVKKIVL